MTTRTTLRRDLADIKQKVYSLGGKCIEVSDLYNSLIENYSSNLEERLNDITNEIKKDSKELNEQCFLVLTLQQPLIKDLRFVIGSLQIVLCLEKTSEQYLSTIQLISEISIIEHTLKEHLSAMSSKVNDLLKNALTHYLSLNSNSSEIILKTFAEINYLHNILYKEILKEVAEVKGEKAQIEAQLLATVRSLEKVADLTINMVEQVNYIIVGKQEP